MKFFLLDTNACIQYLRGRNPVLTARVRACKPRQVCLCSIVVGELYYGAYHSPLPTANLQAVDQLVGMFACLPFDAAREFGSIRATLAAAGTLIGSYDMQIAAIARVNQFTLVTHNVGEFARVAGLVVEDWQV